MSGNLLNAPRIFLLTVVLTTFKISSFKRFFLQHFYIVLKILCSEQLNKKKTFINLEKKTPN